MTSRPAISLIALMTLVVLGRVTTAAAADIGAPMHCITYNVGADTHTECSPGPAPPPAAALRCTNYTVGTDLQAECTPVPATRLGPLRGRITSPPLAVAPHCITYAIGSSRYVECR